MGHSWSEERAKKRIATRYDEVREVEIRDYKRDTSLESIPINRAYRVHGAHVYIDIVNLEAHILSGQQLGHHCSGTCPEGNQIPRHRVCHREDLQAIH